jgi:hypothetical protein
MHVIKQHPFRSAAKMENHAGTKFGQSFTTLVQEIGTGGKYKRHKSYENIIPCE